MQVIHLNGSMPGDIIGQGCFQGGTRNLNSMYHTRTGNEPDRSSLMLLKAEHLDKKTPSVLSISHQHAQRSSRWSTSQPEDQIAHGSGLREERVVAGVEFYDAARPTSELALPIGGGPPVFGAHEVRRGDVLPGR